MEVIEKIKDMQTISKELQKEGQKIGFVPTMGYFHKGHLSLMEIAKQYADKTVVSLFVNPTQFAPNEDLNKYPRDFERDRTLAENIGVDYLFYPNVEEMYPKNYNLTIVLGGITNKFEGIKRPTHFNGVATVVAKLFNIVLPDIAIFGQKDYQQSLVVRKLVKELNFPIKIIVAPTVREKDGLAMSSRNVYLSSEQRNVANILYLALEEAINAINDGEKNRKKINAIMHKKLREVKEIKIDYASAADAETLEEPENFYPGQHIVLLLACYLGKTRLIDNSLITIQGKSDSEFNKSYTDLLPRI